jgi:HK97 family phage major capsid protein
MLSYVEDDSLLNGTGSGNTLHGIYTQASSYVGTYDAAGTNYLDQIKHAAQELLDSNYRADGLVIHPADWNRLTLLKDSLGRYLIDDALGTPSQTLFGLKVAQSMAMTRGHFLVGEFQRAERWLRQGIEILVSYEAEDGDFLKGIVTIRATLREAFQVYRTDAFKVGAFLSGF